MATGSFHSCAWKTDGSMVCWGRNTYHQLGKVSRSNPLVPAKVEGLGPIGRAVAGSAHTCVEARDKAVLCFGHNGSGQLGDGKTKGRAAAVRVEGLGRVKALALGGFHTCAIVSDNSLRCWGSNNRGQLGDGTKPAPRSRKLRPVTVKGVKHAVQITAGMDHTCALVADGRLLCWGSNSHGQLGDGTSTDRALPALVVW